jgi:7-carboxy-7-deazaguanine synthase
MAKPRPSNGVGTASPLSGAVAVASRAFKRDEPDLPVIELFGPTIQGEGPDAGRPAYFVRFGGCDYRCRWCDSMHAVEPSAVSKAERLTANDIVARLRALRPGPQLVVLTGGNPALLKLGQLVDALHSAGFEVAVETQGSRWAGWLARADCLVVSPKPPSSGMAGPHQTRQLDSFLAHLAGSTQSRAVLKVVVFDEADLDWAEALATRTSQLPLLLSAGTDVNIAEPETVVRLRTRYRWLCEAVATRAAFRDVRVLPQLHVIAWGTKQGV